MLEVSIRTVLIPAWQQARRPRKRRGSVACTEQGGGSGVTRSEPIVSVSHVWLRVSFLEDETQWGVNASQCHTVTNVARRSVQGVCVVLPLHPVYRHVPSEGINGVESQPVHDKTSLRCNCGIASAGVTSFARSPAWRRSSHSTQGTRRSRRALRRPVMGPAAGGPKARRIGDRKKLPAMGAKADFSQGKENSNCVPNRARKEEC